MYPSTTTEADLPTFPTEPPNDFLGLNYDGLSFSNGTLTPEMINGLVTNSIGGLGGLIKVLSGIANVNPSKLQKFIKIIDILRSGSVISNGIINFKNGNWQASASHIASGVSSLVYGLWNTSNKIVRDESLTVVLNEKKADENTRTYKLYEGLLSYNDAKELVKLYNDNPEKSLSIKNTDKCFIKQDSNNETSKGNLKEFLNPFTPQGNKIIIDSSSKLSADEYNLSSYFANDIERELDSGRSQGILSGTIN
ncbi:hypothetical protein [Spiroplasma sp. AdecLV25b]|uniref:hypothetical protein n=1 Tax=Spiroplasma sp. AdecLV25b TaxID=3027162 RepID=UPI0027DEB02F|nr:hypothetical protein [Spiroplasma sp. AdecLV25b]